MAAEKIKITVTQYDWTGSAKTPSDASIFSGKPYIESRAQFDLMDYLLDDSLVISWDFEYIKEGYNSPKLLPMGTQVTMLLSNADKSIANYFRVGLNTTYVKWRVKIYYENTMVHEGWVTPEGISYGENQDSGIDTHSLEIRAKDSLTEIKDYFSTKRLISNQEINWSNTHTGTGARNARFGDVLQQNFPGVKFYLTSAIADWKVMETPQIYIAPGVNQNIQPEMWLTSYERVYTSEENRYDWLRRLCNDMGWIMFSFIENESLKIGIKDRSDSTLPLINLNSDRMMDFSKTKELNNSNYDIIMIITGYMDGGDNPFTVSGKYIPGLKGARVIIVSNVYESNYEIKHWGRLRRFSNGNIRFYWDNHRLIKYASEDEHNYHFHRISGSNPHKTELMKIPRDKILLIDGGSAHPFAMKLVVDKGINEGHTVGVTQTGHYDMIYTGCYGEMLRKEGMGYSDYVKTAKFRANFEPFLTHMERQVVNYTQDSLLLSPNYSVSGDGPLEGYTWDISSMEIDLINEITSFKLLSHKIQHSQQ